MNEERRTGIAAGIAGPAAGFERRVHGALEASPSRIPVLLGGCGTGRTWLLQRLRERLGRQARAVHRRRALRDNARAVSPGGDLGVAVPRGTAPSRRPTSAREAFDALLAFFDTARAPGGEPCTFLLDEVLELRTFESFPGLRRVLRELIDALAESPNRFVLTTRYVARAHRLLRDATARFEVMHQPALTPLDVTDVLAPVFGNYERMATDDRDYLGRTVAALTDGRAVYVKAIGEAMAQRRRRARSDQRADRARRQRRRARAAGAASATSCVCIARAATARSRPSSTSSPRKSR